MTDLQRIEISGFKGIERLEFEPSGVNLITGRNNTGKTSLLEAVALALDPTYVEEFGEDIDSLIHRDFEECRIAAETSDNGRKVSFWRPTEEEARHFLVSTIKTRVEETSFVALDLIESQTNIEFKEEKESIQEEIESKVVEIAQSIVNERLNNGSWTELKNECLTFSINKNEYPYVYFGEEIDVIRNEAMDRVLTSGLDPVEELKDIPESTLQTSIVPMLSLRALRGGFLETPPLINEMPFIKSKNLLSAPDFDPDEDAVKRDKLGDYIKETGLVDDLKTFNLDTLIFQKEGEERYPIPYDFMGDGFKTVVGLLWELMDDEIEDQIVLLEEPENHMHPGYVLNVVHFLVELAREEDVQLFVTTHDKDFIDAFFNENRAGEQEEFLKDEFTLLQMQRDSAVVEDYETAREDLEDLHLDLRGI